MDFVDFLNFAVALYPSKTRSFTTFLVVFFSGEAKTMVHRDDVTRTIHVLAHATVLGQAPFPASRQTRDAVRSMMVDAGLVAVDSDTGRITSAPGVAAEFDLLLYVIGLNEPGDFMETEDWDAIEEAFPQGATEEQCLPFYKRKIFAAYAQRYLPSSACQ
jgi:hypothetical protein